MSKLLICLSIITAFPILCHSVDGLTKPTTNHIPKNRRILEHAVTGKCLTVSEEFRLYLETCNYELEEPLIAGVFAVVKSNRGGHVMKWATQPIPGAIEGCLKALPPNKEAENEEDRVKQELLLVECDPRDDTLNWEFVQIEASKHLLKKFPSGPCVVPNNHKEGSGIHAVPCNENDVEQIWQICENVDHRKCDI